MTDQFNNESPATSDESVQPSVDAEAPKGDSDAQPIEGDAQIEEAAEGEAVEEELAPSTTKWYAIHAYSGMEQKVVRNIQYKLDIEDLSHLVTNLLVPTHTVIEIKDGKKHQLERNLMPGYVLIEMEPSDEVFDLIGKLSGVAGFVGDGTRAIALSDEEVDGLLAQTTHRQDKPKTEIQFSRGEVVKIIEGPFAGFSGTVDEIDAQRGKLSVMVSIFGRQTAVELDVLQVDKN